MQFNEFIEALLFRVSYHLMTKWSGRYSSHQSPFKIIKTGMIMIMIMVLPCAGAGQARLSDAKLQFALRPSITGLGFEQALFADSESRKVT